MSIEIIKLTRTRIQPEAVYGVDDSANLGNYIDFPANEGAMVATAQEMIETMLQQQFRHGRTRRVAGVRSASLNLPFNLSATGAANPGNAVFPTATTWGLFRLLRAMLGGARTPTAQAAVTQALAGSTASVLNVTAGHGNTLGAVGGGIAVTINGRLEARKIIAAASGVVTLDKALSATPATNALVYWPAATFFLTEDPAESLQFVCEGAEATDRFVVGGMQGTLSIETAIAQLVKATATLSGPLWVKLSSLALASATVANYSPVPVIDSECILGSGTITATQVRNLINWSSCTWTPSGVAFMDIRSPSGVQTMLRKRGDRAVGVSIALTTYFDAATFDFWAAHAARSDLSLQQQIGSTTAGLILLDAPTVQVMAPTRVDAGGATGISLQFEGRNNEKTAATTEITRSAMTIDVY